MQWSLRTATSCCEVLWLTMPPGRPSMISQELLGHEDMTTVKNYMHMNDETIQSQSLRKWHQECNKRKLLLCCIPDADTHPGFHPPIPLSHRVHHAGAF